MDTLIIRYEKLFSIAWVHADFPGPGNGRNGAASLADELTVEPDAPTSVRFANHGIIPRVEDGALCCYIRTEALHDRPFHPLPPDFSARFLLKASDALIARSALAPHVGGERLYHVRVKLKSTVSGVRLTDSLLASVASATPDLVFLPGYADRPDRWESRTVAISGCLGVLDIVTEGNGKNRLFRQEASQLLNYTVGNGKADQHLYTVTLKA